MPRQRRYMSSKKFADAGVILASAGLTYTDMQEDLREVADEDTGLYVDQMPERMTFVMNGRARKKFPSIRIPHLIKLRLKMGSSFLATTKTQASLLPVVREAYAKVRSIMPVRSGLASRNVRYISNVINGYAGPGFTIKTSLTKADVEDPGAVVGVVGLVDYASVLEQRGFSTTTPFRKTYAFINRKYADRASASFIFVQPGQIGFTGGGKKLSGRYALPAILISHLGNDISPRYRSKASRKYDVAIHRGFKPRPGRRKPGR